MSPAKLTHLPFLLAVWSQFIFAGLESLHGPTILLAYERRQQDPARAAFCFKMHVHLAFVAKFRRRVFDSPAIQRLRANFARVCADFEANRFEMDGEDDHMHLLVEYPPKVPVSSLVNSLKGVSGRMLRKERLEIQKRYWKGALRSPSYFAAVCGGASISIVRQHIEQQQTSTQPRTPLVFALSFPALKAGA